MPQPTLASGGSHAASLPISLRGSGYGVTQLDPMGEGPCGSCRQKDGRVRDQGSTLSTSTVGQSGGVRLAY